MLNILVLLKLVSLIIIGHFILNIILKITILKYLSFDKRLHKLNKY